MKTNKDSSMIAELYQLYEQKMFVEARGILFDDQLAEDAVHDAFLKLIRNRDKLSRLSPSQTSSYVRQTLRSCAIDIYRRNKRDREHLCDIEEAENSIGARDNPDDGALAIVDLLPKQYKDVAVCIFRYELTVKETAAVLRITESCARKRLERAKKILAQMMNETI